MHRSDSGASLTESLPARDAFAAGRDRPMFAHRIPVDDLERRLHFVDAALEASHAGAFRWEVASGAVIWDPHLERVFGLEADAMPRSVDDLLQRVHLEDRARVIETLWASVGDGTGFELVFRIARRDGHVRWLFNRGRTICDGEGVPICVTGVCTDVTDRCAADLLHRRLLDLEHAARLEAERAVRAREEVLAMVAHDLRNPVHTIAMAAALMEDVRLSESERLRHAGIIHRAASVMDRLIHDLLDVARIEAGTFAIEPGPVSVRVLLREVQQMFDGRAHNASVRLTCHAPLADFIVHGDHQRLLQALGNLVDNAVKFTGAGGRVDLRAERRGGTVYLAVEDSGIGIAPDDLTRVFDRFWQAERPARAGAGLGLPIVRGIAAAHGGRAWATSTSGRGSTFWLALPAGGWSVGVA